MAYYLSGNQYWENSLMKHLKRDETRKTRAKISGAKNQAKKTLARDRKKKQAELRQKKQVGNFKMPDAAEPKEGKGKAKDTRVWISCPLLPGVPTVPPPYLPQPWELQRSHDITEEEDDVIEDTPLDLTIPQRLLNGTPPQTPLDLVMVPVPSTVKSETIPPARTPPARTPSARTPPARTPPARTPPARTTPARTPAARTPPARTPPARTPPARTTPARTPAARTPPARTPPARTPPARTTHARTPAARTSPARTPPARTRSRKKKRLIQFSPSASKAIIKSDVSPENPVLVENVEIEFLEFTPYITEETEHNPPNYVIEVTGTPLDVTIPQGLLNDTPPQTAPDSVMDFTTSKAAPNSGRSACETDVSVDIDIELDFPEHGEGSDVEPEDNLGDITLKPWNDIEYLVDCEILEDQSLAEAIKEIDAAADSALRTVIGPDQDLLNFDWRCERENFEGVREIFTVPSTGPTFENTDLTPLDVFLKIWDADIIAHIVRETNRYSGEMMRRNQKPYSRIKRWKDVTDDDIKKFFAIMMLQSLVVNNVEREYWYPKLNLLRIGNFGAIMPYNRFLMIKRCLHFVDNASLPVHPNRLHKIMPIIEHLNKKFGSLYVLEQNVAIDESLLLWKGRLSFVQKIATKKARVGIKSYELCESRTGYLWRMEIYSGKGHVHVAQVGAQEPVEEHEERDDPEGATSQIVLTLMRPLFNRGHTIVMDNFYNSPLLSRILKVKHKTDSMGTLRLCRAYVPEGLKNKSKKNMKAGEVAFSTTKDLSVVVWMDKQHIVSMISTFHQVQVGGKEKYGHYKYKPQVILDYNLTMGGIDHKDQMLHAYPIERVRNTIWYKKLFRRLVNVSIHNSFVMFNHNRTQTVGNRDFRLQLVHGLLQICGPVTLPRPLPPAAPAPQSQMHLPAKNLLPQRCKLCATAKVRRTTVWRCSTCAVNLCIQGCYNAYHVNK